LLVSVLEMLIDNGAKLRSKEAATKLIKNSIITLLDRTAKINREAASTVAPLFWGGDLGRGERKSN
jgi:hypothetical protein